MCQSKVQITSAWRVDGGRREDLFYIQIHVGYSWAGYKLRKRQDTRWENAWVMEGEGSWLPWAGTIRWCYLKCVGKEKKRGVVGFNSKSAKKKKGPGRKGELDSLGEEQNSAAGQAACQSPCTLCPRSWHSLALLCV